MPKNNLDYLWLPVDVWVTRFKRLPNQELHILSLIALIDNAATPRKRILPSFATQQQVPGFQGCNVIGQGSKGSSKVPGLFPFFGACIFVSPLLGPRGWNPTDLLLGTNAIPTVAYPDIYILTFCLTFHLNLTFCPPFYLAFDLA